MNNHYVLDSSAILALINSEQGHEKVSRYLPESCVSSVNLSEIAAILHLNDIPYIEIRSILSSLISQVIHFDETHAYKTAELRPLTKKLGLSIGDRACLALGKINDIPVITADQAWAKLDIGVKIILIR